MTRSEDVKKYVVSRAGEVFPNGLIIGHYERGGEIKTSDTALDSPSDREAARRERMKREGQGTDAGLCLIAKQRHDQQILVMAVEETR